MPRGGNWQSSGWRSRNTSRLALARPGRRTHVGCMDTLPDREPDPATSEAPPEPTEPAPAEIGGPKGAEPTRYGDWTVKGRCIDF